MAFCLACEVASSTLEVERVGVWLFIDGRTALRCATLYERSRQQHSCGAILRVADFPTYFESLTLRKAVPAEVAAWDPRTTELAAAYLDPLGITSMLDAGIFVDGELVGVVCHEHVGPPCEWTTEARDFAGSVADFLALRIKSAEFNDLKATFRTQKERLVALQQAQALEQIARGLVHDFTNLLSVISGSAQLMEGDSSLSDSAREEVRMIVDTAHRGQALLNELREFSRSNPRPPTVLDLGAATAEFLPLLRGALGPKHQAQFECPSALDRVLLDKTQYSRVLLNLVLNARDAMPNGGKIRIRLAPVEIPSEKEEGGNYVLLEVSDTGVGMDEQTQKQVLEPFFTTKPQGTGLGLAIVHRIVDQAGGMVQIESAPGKGTTARVYFPRVGSGSGGSLDCAGLA